MVETGIVTMPSGRAYEVFSFGDILFYGDGLREPIRPLGLKENHDFRAKRIDDYPCGFVFIMKDGRISIEVPKGKECEIFADPELKVGTLHKILNERSEIKRARREKFFIDKEVIPVLKENAASVFPLYPL